MPKQPPLSNLNLEVFLEHKTLYYDKIDFSVVQNAWKVLEPYINVPYVIHIVGTNGKGTTGRFLATYLNKKNQNTLHYTSPHISEFNERIWINGANVSNEALEVAHQKLLEVFEEEVLQKLTYFEYTTFLALLLSSNRDYLILEAGLGGEFDATNVVHNDLSLITTIGLDHMAFLGDTIEAISKTKMRSVDTHMLLGHQVYEEVFEHAKSVQQQRGFKLSRADMSIDLSTLKTPLPLYLQNNLKLAIAALNHLKFDIDLSQLESVTFQGRCEKITRNITIDVGHNSLAAQELVKEFLPKKEKIILIYNSFEDKDYEMVLKILKPIIDRVEILQLEDKRVVKEEILTQVCDKLNIISKPFRNLDIHQEYLVFGSFLVVEKFLRKYKEFNEK